MFRATPFVMVGLLATTTLATTTLAASTLTAAAAPARITAPLQPWRSPDRTVALLRPAIAAPERAAPALGALMVPGWRLVWDGVPTAGAGDVALRLQLPAAPKPPETAAVEVLQVGTSRDPDIVPRCLHDGLTAAHTQRLPDRTLGGIRFLAWHNADAGNGQAIDALDLRAIVGGTCYAAERFRYARTGTPAPTAGTRFPPAAALLDASLASLRVGPAARRPPRAPALRLPRGAVSR